MNGPSDDYVSGRKRQYRREIWNVLESLPALASVPLRDRRVLVLDEWRAQESEFLVHRGYSPANITAVNLRVGSAARVTLSLRQLGIEGVTSKSGDVGEVWTRLADAGGRFHAVHLDFCGNISIPMIETLESFNGMSNCGPTAVAVNMLCGREASGNPIYRDAVDSLVTRCGATTNDARLRPAFLAITGADWFDPLRTKCRQHLLFPTSRSYISSNGQRMLWMAGELRNHGASMTDQTHRAWVWRVAGARTRPDMWPEGSWAVPRCFTALAAGRDMTLRQAFEALDQSSLCEKAQSEGGSFEVLITLGVKAAARFDVVKQRKLSDSKLGPILTRFEQRLKSDTRRQTGPKGEPL